MAAVEEGLNSLTNNNAQKEYYLTDMIGWAAGKKLPVAAVIAQDWREVAGINSRLELAEANRLLRDIAVARLVSEGVTFVDPVGTWVSPEVNIGPDTVVLPGCYLTGDIEIGANCVIGPHTVMSGKVQIGDSSTVTQSLADQLLHRRFLQIGPFAHLRDTNVLSDHVRIGNFVEIKNSNIGDHTNVSHLSYVGDTEIGSRANIGAGPITANYNHITKAKNRTIIGNDASTGSNSVLVAPVTLGDGAFLAAGSVATKEIPPGAWPSRAPSRLPNWFGRSAHRRRRQRASRERKRLNLPLAKRINHESRAFPCRKWLYLYWM